MVGLNYFLSFLPYPEMPESAGLFLKALQDTGYMVPMIKCVELLAAVLFLLNRFVPLAIVIITPGIVNILIFIWYWILAAFIWRCYYAAC